MRSHLGFLFLVGVLAACGGSIASDPKGGGGSGAKSGGDAPGGTSSSSSSGGGGTNGSRGSNPVGTDPAGGDDDPQPDCPPSAHPPNSPDCPATFRDACHSANPTPQIAPIECWYPGQGDGTSNGCWSDALFMCRETDDGDGGKALRCACAQ